MLTINKEIYNTLAEQLEEQIDGREFYSDQICLEQPEADYRFSATLMIYYRNVHYIEGYDTQISNIVPVWWEFHSITDEGERLNDFDFNILKKIICN